MKRLSIKLLLAFGFIASLFTFNACQKDGFNPTDTQQVSNVPGADDRSPTGFTYGVTVFSNTSPSRIIQIDEATGNQVGLPVQAFYIDNAGNVVNFDNLKGICLTSWGQWFLTTGAPANPTLGPSVYDNNLYKVNPVTGQCSFFNSVCAFGTVSDLEYDGNAGAFYGLINNTNQITNITNDINGNPTVYAPPAAITNIAGGRTLKGLTLVSDASGTYLVGAANRTGNPFVSTQLYRIPAGGGPAALITDLAPGANFNGGHCGIGYDRNLNHLAVNRVVNGFGVGGLSEINPWFWPLGAVTGTNVWGTTTWNYEDLSSFN